MSSLLLGLLIAGHTVLETARDALFLEQLPATRLPWVYAALAALSLVASAASTVFARRFGRRAALVLSLLGCAYVVTLLELLAPTPAVVFTLYLTSGVIGTVLLLQFWMFAGQLYTVSQAKRLFGAIGSGGVLGATLGAGAAAVTLRFAPTGALLLLGAAIFVLAAAVVVQVPVPREVDGRASQASPERSSSWRGLGGIRDERYLRLVAALTGLGTATVLLADYLFKSLAAAHVPSSELGGFFATFYAAQNAIALVVQVLVTGAVVRKLGVTSALLLLPMLLGSGGVLLMFGGGLLVALVVKGADGSLRHSLHRVSSELLLLPLSLDDRERAKPVFDTVFGRGVQALVAGAILALGALGWTQPRVLGALLAVFGGAWMLAALALRRPYVDLFRRALSLGQLDARQVGAELDLASVEALLEGLASTDEEQVLASIDVLVESEHARLLPSLILHHDSPRVLRRALDVLATPDRRDWIPLAERLLERADPEVRASAVRALAGSGMSGIAERATLDPSPQVRVAAAFFLADARDPLGDARLGEILERDGADGFEARLALLALLGDYGQPSFAGVVDRILERDRARPRVAALAAAAIERTAALHHLPYLVASLGTRGARQAVREALVRLGDPGFEAARAALSDPHTPLALRRELPSVIAGFPRQAAVDLLAAQLASESSGAVRYKILRALGRLSNPSRTPAGAKLRFEREVFERETQRALEEHLRIEGLLVGLHASTELPRIEANGVGGALLGLLEDKAAQSLERAFRCLQLVHRHEDIEGVHDALRRGDRVARSHALEFLEALRVDRPAVKELLRLVVDDLEPAERVRRAAALVPPAPADHDAALAVLLDDPEELVAALAAYHVLDAGIVRLRPLVLEAFARRPQLEKLGARPVGASW